MKRFLRRKIRGAYEAIGVLILLAVVTLAALYVGLNMIEQSRTTGPSDVVSISYAKIIYLSGSINNELWVRVEVGISNPSHGFQASICLYSKSETANTYEEIKCKPVYIKPGFNSISFETEITYADLSPIDDDYKHPSKWVIVLEVNGVPKASAKPVYIVP